LESGRQNIEQSVSEDRRIVNGIMALMNVRTISEKEDGNESKIRGRRMSSADQSSMNGHQRDQAKMKKKRIGRQASSKY